MTRTLGSGLGRQRARAASLAAATVALGGVLGWASSAEGAPGAHRPAPAPPVPINAPVVRAQAIPDTDRAERGGAPIDLSWAPQASAAQGRPVVLLKTATWCPPCGGRHALTPVEAAAKAAPGTQFVVVLHSEPAETAARIAAGVFAPNVAVLAGDETTGADTLGGEFGSTIPALVRLDASHAVTRVAVGARPVVRALAQP